MEPNAPTQLNADEFASLRKLSLTPSMLDIPHIFTYRGGKIASRIRSQSNEAKSDCP
jgi:hypothetical protein